MPPERKAPTGTSATICQETDWSNSASNCSPASVSSPLKGRATPASAISCSDQYGSGRGRWRARRWASVNVSTQPGGNLWRFS